MNKTNSTSFSRFLLRLMGWKVKNSVESTMPEKAVVIAAPHTSMFDFVLGFLAFKAMKLNAKFLIKKEAFVFPFSSLLHSLGGISVDRANNTTVEDMIKEFNSRDKFILALAPEATRKKVKSWKTGYHRIAFGANVPVLIGYIDAKTKTVGILSAFELSSDIDKDTQSIRKLYEGMEGINKDMFL